MKKNRAQLLAVAAISLISMVSVVGCGASDTGRSGDIANSSIDSGINNSGINGSGTADSETGQTPVAESGTDFSVPGVPSDDLPNPGDLASNQAEGQPDTDDQSDQDIPFEIAEYFFTDDDRQWFCSVTSPVSMFTDQFYLDRFGSAVFERFGIAEWSSHDELDQLDVVTALGVRFSIKEIFATNTVLEFLLQHDSAGELYDCVLTTREEFDL